MTLMKLEGKESESMIGFRRSSSRRRGGRLIAIAAALLPALLSPALRAQTGPLFPQPFRVEHHVVQDDGDGSRFVGESVVDTYGGSWIVSQRPDGNRLIVDLARRELTEVQPEKGTYWTLSFDRLAELQVRLRQAQGLGPRGGDNEDGARSARASSSRTTAASGSTGARDGVDADLLITDAPVADKSLAAAPSSSVAAAVGGGAPSERPGVKHLRIASRQAPGAVAADVWVDPALRLTPSAQAAIGALETALAVPAASSPSAAGTDKAGASDAQAPPVSPARLLAAVRNHTGGALPVRTVRALLRDDDGTATASVEDVATRVEPLDRFPTELAEVPEGARRVPHPLEATVRFLEAEAARNAALSGTDGSRP
ncbi:MAG TPA: hypothetical protein VFS60_11570 [Thermoanaerobaculia bacterium]|nr:hypothetical protein [Thermoanaerobaculia bacterium]